MYIGFIEIILLKKYENDSCRENILTLSYVCLFLDKCVCAKIKTVPLRGRITNQRVSRISSRERIEEET